MSVSYEKLFMVINLLKSLWNNYAKKQPKLWKSYALDHPDVLKLLYKISFTVADQGAHPCLCLLATAFEKASPTVFDSRGGAFQ